MFTSSILISTFALSLAAPQLSPISAISAPVVDWTKYPAQDVIATNPRASWVATYQAARARGLIPNIPPSTAIGGNVVYPANSGVNCSWTLTQCFDGEDIYQAPPSVIGLSFDDGPTDSSLVLLQYLKSQNITATHFLIGSRIMSNPQAVLEMVQQGEHLAGHSWSHHYVTSLTDLQVIAEIGYGLQAIFDLTGLSPRYFRFPYGDADERVRAIARHVFGLTIVFWNEDTNDWCIGTNECGAAPVTPTSLDAELHKFYSQPKSPGLVILEHELAAATIGGFSRTYPFAKLNNWSALSIPDMLNTPWYHNSVSGSSTVSRGAIGVGNITITPITPTHSSILPYATPVIVSTSVGIANAAAVQSNTPSIARVSCGNRISFGGVGFGIILVGLCLY